MKKISVIIPVYNEERNINRALTNISSWCSEVIVVDGEPSGSTLNSINQNFAFNIKQAVSPSKGRAYQMNYGASMASGDILLFLHADTILPDNCEDLILSAVTEGFSAGCFRLSFDSSSLSMKFISTCANLRTSISRIPFGDQALFFTSEIFKDVGGYSDMPLMEDIDIMQKCRKKKLRIGIVPDPVVTSARKWREEGVLYTSGRNAIIQLLYYCGTSPEKLVKYYYRSAK